MQQVVFVPAYDIWYSGIRVDRGITWGGASSSGRLAGRRRGRLQRVRRRSSHRSGSAFCLPKLLRRDCSKSSGKNSANWDTSKVKTSLSNSEARRAIARGFPSHSLWTYLAASAQARYLDTSSLPTSEVDMSVDEGGGVQWL